MSCLCPVQSGPRPSIAHIAKADGVGQKGTTAALAFFTPLRFLIFFSSHLIHIILTTIDTVSDFESLRSLLHLKAPLISF